MNDKHETCPNYKLAGEISYIETVLMNFGVSDAVHDTISQLLSFFGTLHLRDCLYLPRSQLFCQPSFRWFSDFALNYTVFLDSAIKHDDETDSE